MFSNDTPQPNPTRMNASHKIIRRKESNCLEISLLRRDLNIYYVFLLSDLDGYIYIQGDGYFGWVGGKKVRHSWVRHAFVV